MKQLSRSRFGVFCRLPAPRALNAGFSRQLLRYAPIWLCFYGCSVSSLPCLQIAHMMCRGAAIRSGLHHVPLSCHSARVTHRHHLNLSWIIPSFMQLTFPVTHEKGGYLRMVCSSIWYDSSVCCQKAEEMWSNLLCGGRNLIHEHCFEQMKTWDCACLGKISLEGLFCSLTSCSEIIFF